jgi:hypothetical protein
MLRIHEIPLQAHCVEQYFRWDENAWFSLDLPPRFVGTSAALLAHFPAYGHAEQLLAIADKLNPAAGLDLVGELRAIELYPDRFVDMVRMAAYIQVKRGIESTPPDLPPFWPESLMYAPAVAMSRRRKD